MKLLEPYPLIILEWPEYRKRKFSLQPALILLLGILFLILTLGLSYDIIMHSTSSGEIVSHGLEVIKQQLIN